MYKETIGWNLGGSHSRGETKKPSLSCHRSPLTVWLQTSSSEILIEVLSVGLWKWNFSGRPLHLFFISNPGNLIPPVDENKGYMCLRTSPQGHFSAGCTWWVRVHSSLPWSYVSLSAVRALNALSCVIIVRIRRRDKSTCNKFEQFTHHVNNVFVTGAGCDMGNNPVTTLHCQPAHG